MSTLLFGRLLGHLLGRREQRPDLHVEAEIGEARGDDLLAAVVAVLAHLGDEDARAAPGVLLERARHGEHARRWPRAVARLGEVDAGNCADIGDVPAEHLLHRERDLADRRLGARRLDAELQKVGGAARAFRQRRERRLGLRLVALGAQMLQLLDLHRAHFAASTLRTLISRSTLG